HAHGGPEAPGWWVTLRGYEDSEHPHPEVVDPYPTHQQAVAAMQDSLLIDGFAEETNREEWLDDVYVDPMPASIARMCAGYGPRVTLIDPGDLVVVESPTYLGAAQVFRAAGARLLTIPVDQDGMQVDLLQEVLPRRRPKLIYTLPTFQNPSGAVLSMGRRLRLLDLAARYQIPVVEDDPYGALRYDGRTLPTLAAIDQAEGRANVIYLSTVSKMLFPGFRIGWVSAPKPVAERLTLMKQLVDLDTNALAQRAVWAFFSRGLLDQHLARVNAAYPKRRDRMLAALEEFCGDLVTANRPEGGIYLWCRLAEGIRVRDLLPEAAHEGVVFAPGESFHVDAASGRGRYDMRLNFTLPAEAEIDEGIRRLSAAVHRLADRLDATARHPTAALTPIV
ncbi:MAG TPA: PLP-dependent aminotransferase family protein, partial [Thermomicrobiales bacterium]|nr:PLP-dependent aminotransferase family protein [Thermomicrobiales bacterium]